jgi:AraC-like DNA-binding protein
MKKVFNVTIEDIIKKARSGESILDYELIIIETNGILADRLNTDILPIRINAYSLIVVCHGEMTIGVDYMTYHMKKNDIMELFNHHILEYIRITPDFKAYQIVISPDLYDGIVRHTDLSSSIDIYTERFRLVKTLDINELSIMKKQIERVKSATERKDYHMLKNIVIAELSLLLLELANIKLLQRSIIEQSYKHSKQEGMISRFIQLLINHCKTESEVTFYSQKLCITPEYLTRIIKSFSGKPVSVWIQQARISEAKVLLRKPNSSVYQVAEELCFSDQSAFGKFFKKHTGKSPAEYQKEVNQYT